MTESQNYAVFVHPFIHSTIHYSNATHIKLHTLIE